MSDVQVQSLPTNSNKLANQMESLDISHHDNVENKDSNTTGVDDKLRSESTEEEISEQQENTEDDVNNPDKLAIDQNPEFSIKHPLQNSWVWWYDNPGRKTNQQSWVNHLKRIYSFSTVEDFWSLFNNLKPAREITPGSNYHIFKEGIEPKWEDQANTRGGKWIVQMPPKLRASHLDQNWMWMVLACIGENFEDSDQICGCVVSVRKQNDRLALWTRDAHNEGACVRIGEKLKEVLGISNQTIGYQCHADSITRNSSFNNKSKYEV